MFCCSCFSLCIFFVLRALMDYTVGVTTHYDCLLNHITAQMLLTEFHPEISNCVPLLQRWCDSTTLSFTKPDLGLSEALCEATCFQENRAFGSSVEPSAEKEKWSVFINSLSAAASYFAKRRNITSVCQHSDFNTAKLNRRVGKRLKWKRKHCQENGLRSSRDKAKGPAQTPELASTEPTKTLFYLNIKNIWNGKEITLTHVSQIASWAASANVNVQRCSFPRAQTQTRTLRPSRTCEGKRSNSKQSGECGTAPNWASLRQHCLRAPVQTFSSQFHCRLDSPAYSELLNIQYFYTWRLVLGCVALVCASVSPMRARCIK